MFTAEDGCNVRAAETDGDLREFLRESQSRIRPSVVARRREGLRAILAQALSDIPEEVPTPQDDLLFREGA